MDPQDPDERTTQSPPSRRFTWLWLPVVFVVGILAGGVIVAVFSDSGSAHPATPRPTVTVTRAATAGGSHERVLVGTGCVKVINDAQQTYTLLAKLGAAVRDLNPGALEELVQRARGVEQRLQHELHGCRATLQVPGSAMPTPSPTG